MEYTRRPYTSDPTKPIQQANVTFIWSSDGWCYIPELKMRQRYTEDKYFFESWEGIIAPVLNLEKVDWSLYSRTPRRWRESGDIFEQSMKTHPEVREGQRPSP